MLHPPPTDRDRDWISGERERVEKIMRGNKVKRRKDTEREREKVDREN